MSSGIWVFRVDEWMVLYELIRLKCYQWHRSCGINQSDCALKPAPKPWITYRFYQCCSWWEIRITESDVWLTQHDDVIKWKHFPRYWPFVRRIHRSPVNSPHKRQWRGALMFSLICAWINRWVNNGEAGDLRRHGAHCDVIVMMRPNCAIWRHGTCSKSDHALGC